MRCVPSEPVATGQPFVGLGPEGRHLSKRMEKVLQHEPQLLPFPLQVIRDLLVSKQKSERVFAVHGAVSYTHLDVYKRQDWNCCPLCIGWLCMTV